MKRTPKLGVLAALVASVAACGRTSSSSVVSSGSSVASSGSTVFSPPPPTYIGGAAMTCGVDTSLRVPFPDAAAEAEDRRVTPTDIEGFITAFAAFNGTSRADVVVVPGTARVAYMPSIKTMWGLATFSSRPGASAANAGSNAFKPPYNMLAFHKAPECPWAYSGPLFVPFPCPGRQDIPVGVQRAWAIKSPTAEACAGGYTPPAPR